MNDCKPLVDGCTKCFKTQELLKQHGRCHTVGALYTCVCGTRKTFCYSAQRRAVRRRL
jgi:hypothetical protein